MENFFETLRNKTIAITGASGLIGQECIRQFTELNKKSGLGIKLIALVRNPNEFVCSQNVEVKEYNLLTKFELKFDFIIHLAGNATPKSIGDNPYNTGIENTIGMMNVIQQAIKNKAKILYVSSCEVYGYTKKCSSEIETASFNTTIYRNCYPISKLYNENLCACASEEFGLQYNIVRPCYVFGSKFSNSDNRVIPQFIRSIKNNKEIIMKSKGQQKRMYLDVIDCVKALILVLAKGKNGEIYNIPGEEVTIKRIAKILSKIANVPILYQFKKDKGTSGIKKIIINGEKIKSLGWEPQINLEKGLLNVLRENNCI